ncbi:hypothetical protein FGB62_62g229 [Gracilaria domingensis]|nr:hypothetical protein FGB62_62g229 [Gracilaria domingensis]
MAGGGAAQAQQSTGRAHRNKAVSSRRNADGGAAGTPRGVCAGGGGAAAGARAGGARARFISKHNVPDNAARTQRVRGGSGVLRRGNFATWAAGDAV